MAGAVHKRTLSNGVLVVEIDNPPMNAMNGAMLALMSETFAGLVADTSVRAIVLTGRGRAFCSGADLKEVARETHAGGGEDLAGFGRMLDLVAASRAPVIAAINGACVGGGFELALCCDIRIAVTTAKFVCAGVNVGLMASTYRLPRLIGLSRAKAMLLTGSAYSAAEAEAWGLVTAVHASDALQDAALGLAARIASRAPLSVEASKRTAGHALDLSPEQAKAMVEQEMPKLRASDDHREAVQAFIDKRDPVFRRH